MIEDGVIVIHGNRIAAVGRRGEVAVPAGATVVDVAGKTIIPGLIDAHAHGPQGEDELVPQQNWSLHQNLALGTTTIHDPSARVERGFRRRRDAARGQSSARASSRPARSSMAPSRRRLRPDRQLRRRAGPRPPPEGAGRAQRQELQPAAPRPAPAGGRGRPPREYAGRRRGRVAVRDGHGADRRRQFDAGAQCPADRFYEDVLDFGRAARPTTRRPWW